MNPAEKIALSERIAKKYGVEAFTIDYNCWGEDFDPTYLADDSGRCAELAWENELMVQNNAALVHVSHNKIDEMTRSDSFESYTDHPSIAEATRIAILLCLDKMKCE